MLDLAELLTRFPAWNGRAEADSYRDALGVRTRMTYLPPVYMELGGRVFETVGHGLHDPLEWAGVLRSVLEAKGRFVCAELGAGWGPFVVGAARAASAIGIDDVKLIAVEGAHVHIEFMHQHFLDNGINPADHKIIHGIVGAHDGVAMFPRLQHPTTEWSGEAIFEKTPSETGGGASANVDELPCLSLGTLLKEESYVNVVHFDIQGAEAEAIKQAAAELSQKVRRLIIGTHGRDIEQQLLNMMDSFGWTLEAEKSCTFEQSRESGLSLAQDGIQVWSNRYFD